MAGRTVLGRRFIEKNLLGANLLEQLVTVAALYVLVSAAPGEGGPLFMIEQRRLPFHAVVAVGTRRRFSFGELLTVDVFVTILADGRCGLEIHVDQLGFKIRRLVTVDTTGRQVGAKQGKFGLGMVESSEFLPGLGGMAGLATKWCSIRLDQLHALVELALVSILVTVGTDKVLPVIDDIRFWLKLG